MKNASICPATGQRYRDDVGACSECGDSLIPKGGIKGSHLYHGYPEDGRVSWKGALEHSLTWAANALVVSVFMGLLFWPIPQLAAMVFAFPIVVFVATLVYSKSRHTIDYIRGVGGIANE